VTDWVPTREDGLARMAAFRPGMGRAYAAGRNTDPGPEGVQAVSALSPWVRRRLVLEEELVAAALADHGPAAAEKFVQEVFWRGYFKGWLELRPQVWAGYATGLRTDLASLTGQPALADAIAMAEARRTGIAPFDAWARELVKTGWLHNHAWMWFASIWIFTLRLPWRVGADFFLRHLVDGDAASNTLSWRWVGGLHTRNKAYFARADNIARFTDGRFRLPDGVLADEGPTLAASEPDGLPPVQPLRTLRAPERRRPTALLLTDEDGRIGDFDPAALDLRAVAVLQTSHLRSPRLVSDAVRRFDSGALADTAMRVGLTAQALTAASPVALADWAEGAGATQIVTPYATRGPLHDWLCEATPQLTARGIVLAEWTRPWDRAIWPLSTAGYFGVKKRIPDLVDRLTLSRQGRLDI
jgi:deoxyribodipyrimidine photo-lyase